MPGLLPEKILSIFIPKPAYKRDGFNMWGRIIERYDTRGKEALFKSVPALFESVSALHTLEQAADK